MNSARTEKERLRALIGLDGPDNLVQTSKETLIGGTITEKIDLPSSNELIFLLQKQDQIISELYGQLNLCKNEINDLRDRNLSQTQDNQKVFEELRAQILKQNLLKAVNQHANGITPQINQLESVATKFEPSFCSNCEILQDVIKNIEREKQNLQTKAKRASKESAEVKLKEKEHLQKIRQAVQLADETILEKAEITMKWRQSEENASRLTEEIKSQLLDHQKSLQQCKENAFAQHNAELQSLRSQLIALSEKESTVSQQNDGLKKQCELTKEELADVRLRLSKIEKDSEMKLATNENTLLETSKEKERLEKVIKELQHEYTVEKLSSQQKISQLEQSLSDQTMQLQSCQSSLKLMKKDDMELLERCAILEKEVSSLRYSRRRLENDKESILQRSSLELKESLRMADLKQEQTKAELEQLINTQNSLILKLKEECKFINEKMARMIKEHKREKKTLKKEKVQNEDYSSSTH